MGEDRNRNIKFAITVMFIAMMILLVIRFFGNIIDSYKEERKMAVESTENIDEYIIKEDVVTDTEIKEANLVKGYREFYTLQNVFSNYIDALLNGKYADTYSIATQDIKSKYDRNTYIQKIEEYTKLNFVDRDSSNVYNNSYNLKYLYKIDENVYIGEIENMYGELVKIGVVLITKESRYRVFYVEI